LLKKDKKPIFLTVDFEDYRYNFTRDYLNQKKYYIEEVEKQYWLLSNILKKINARALFYLVGEVANKISNDLIKDIKLNYDIGSHSLSHLKLINMNEAEIYNDTKKSIELIEDRVNQKIEHYRAPYFSIDKNEENYYQGISKAGVKFSSSLRQKRIDTNYIINLKKYKIIEIPLRSIGFGRKRITIIGGTYFRIMPISLIDKLISDSIKLNFLPIIYLHNYEVDYSANPILEKNKYNVKLKLNDSLRRVGRSTVEKKLIYLSKKYSFESLDNFVKNNFL
tara:strand:+ start:18864 stop:19700 length:837 start_codon:yes stop_codon:yes gene_type:complete